MEKYFNKPQKSWAWVLLLPMWVYGAFLLVQLIIVAAGKLLVILGVQLADMNQVVLTSLLSFIAYTLTTLVVVGIPLKLFKRRTTRKELGVPDWLSWMDIALAPPAYVVYAISSGVFMLLMTKVFTGIDVTQAQEIPFGQTILTQGWQYMLAFLVIVVLAPLAEELLFRGYMYGKARQAAPMWLAILATSLAFGLAHLWTGPGNPLQWAVMLDTFVLAVMLSLLREYTGAIWAGVMVHMVKNGIAFYLLFVNTDIINKIQAAVLPLL